MPLPGRLPTTVRLVRTPGQTRNVSALAAPNGSSPKTLYGGGRNVTWISVAVTGMHLPAADDDRDVRPSARSRCSSRVAKNVSVVEPGATPSTSR